VANIQKIEGKKGVKYRVLVRLKGCPAQSATFARLTDARRWAQDTESAIRDGRHFKTVEAKRHTVAEMIDRYLKDVLPGRKDVRNTTRQLLYWREQIGQRTLADVTPALLVSIRDQLAKGPYTTTRTTGEEIHTTERYRTPATVNRYLAALSHCLGVAVTEWQWIEANPMGNIRKQPEPQGRVRFLSDDERDRLLTACQASPNPHLLPVVILALSTGMRQGEILGLTWADVDFDAQRITLHETKNGERRAVHLTGKALALLRELRAKDIRPGSDLVFPARRILCNGPAAIRTAWTTALKTAGITNFRFHDLRHSAASYLAMNGASLIDIAAVLGHRTLAMVKRYSHLSESHVNTVVASMNQKIFGE
jgi:integrase